jgi:co-chaperonin GroES (HSP10)
LVDDLFIIEEDQLYLYRKNDNSEWKAPNEFCFIKPIDNDNEGEVIQTIGHDKELWGTVKYTNSFMPQVNVGDTVSFTPDSEYEFKIDDERLFRMRYKNICLVKDKKS